MSSHVSLRLLAPDRGANVTAPRRWWMPRPRPPHTSRHHAAIRQIVGDTPIRASADGIALGVALTDRELLIGRARLFRSNVERYSLNRLLRVRLMCNRSIDLLELIFADPRPTTVIVMSDLTARADMTALYARLQRRLSPLHPRRRFTVAAGNRLRLLRAAGHALHLQPV
jgi:hypothetical protein